MGIQINGQTDTVTAIDGSLNVGGDVTIPGVLTYDDVTNVDSVGVITARNGIDVTGGSVVIADKIIHLGDTDTAIRFPSNNTFSVETGGTERLRVRSNGIVAIGTHESTTINYAAAQTQIFHTGDRLLSLMYGEANSSGPQLNFAKGRDGDNSASTAVNNNDLLGSLHFVGADGSDFNSVAAEIAVNVDASPGNNDMPGRIVFKTTASGESTSTERLRITSSGIINSNNYSFNGQGTNTASDVYLGTFAPGSSAYAIATNGAERLRITSSGNVGVGTDNPNSRQLSVYGLGVNGTQIECRATGGTSSGLSMYAGRNFEIQSTSSAEANYPDSFIVYDRDANGYRMSIDGSGRVLMPAQPSFFSRPAAGYNLSAGANTIGGTWQDVHDIGSHFSNGTFTAPVAGTYQFSWSVFVQSETTRIDAYIMVNGTNVMREEIQGYSATGYNKNASVHGSYYLSANDAITFGLHSTAGTNIYVAAQPWSYASGFLVG